MKKLLVLTLVLGMASVANAVVALSIDGANPSDGTEDIIRNTTIELSVVSSTVDPWIMDVKVLKADATLGTPQTVGYLGADLDDYSDETWWCYKLITAGPPGTINAGQQWIMDLSTSLSVGSVLTVSLGEYGIPPASTIDFTVVPEPMTIALLGLGGLLALHRRK